ncbi:MAG TPA: hypothetical protein V6D17_02160 [Candidatus Obscuribacterales bacterium]
MPSKICLFLVVFALSTVPSVAKQTPVAKKAIVTKQTFSPAEQEATMLYMQAGYLSTLGQMQQALPLWQKLEKEKPNDGEIKCHLGWTLFQLGRKEEGRRFIAEGVKLAPNSIFAHRYMGFIFMFENKVPDAIREFKIAMKLDPTKKCNCGPYDQLVKKYDKLTPKVTARKH